MCAEVGYDSLASGHLIGEKKDVRIRHKQPIGKEQLDGFGIVDAAFQVVYFWGLVLLG